MNKLNDDTVNLIYKYVHILKMKDICKEIYDYNHISKKINIDNIMHQNIFKNMTNTKIIAKYNNIKFIVTCKNKDDFIDEIMTLNTYIGKNRKNILIIRKYNKIKLIF